MAAPIPASPDTDAWAEGDTDATPAMDHPAHSIGDLVIQCMVQDNDDSITQPTSGLNSESLVLNFEGDSGDNNGPRLAVIAWVADAAQSAVSVDWAFAVARHYESATIVIPAGEFDSVTPIDSESLVAGSPTLSSTVDTPAWNGTAAGGRVICFLAIDARSITVEPSGWTKIHEQTRATSKITLAIVYRDAETTATESIASVDYIISASDTHSTFGIVVNGPAAGGSIISQIFHHRRMQQG